MLLRNQPSEEDVRRFLTAQRRAPFSYPDVGATRKRLPEGYVVDHNRVRLGEGAAAFESAAAAVRRWEMFRLGWVRIFWPTAPIEARTTVAVLVRHFGIWSLNACRIVYVVDRSAPTRVFGFAYGTLPEHAERGEERFTVEWRKEDDSVWYEILAFSQPAHLFARIGYPLARRLQRRFARDSLAAMMSATRPEPVPGAAPPPP